MLVTICGQDWKAEKGVKGKHTHTHTHVHITKRAIKDRRKTRKQFSLQPISAVLVKTLRQEIGLVEFVLSMSRIPVQAMRQVLEPVGHLQRGWRTITTTPCPSACMYHCCDKVKMVRSEGTTLLIAIYFTMPWSTSFSHLLTPTFKAWSKLSLGDAPSKCQTIFLTTSINAKQ